MESVQLEQVAPTSPVPDILTRLVEVVSTIESLKRLYEEQELLTLQLREIVGTDTEVASGDMIFKVVDNFKEKNVVFRPAAVRRFDLVVDSQTARDIKAAKELEKASKKALKK